MGRDTLRVIHITAGSDAGGISRYLLTLNAALVNEGVEVTVVGEKGPWHDHFMDAGVRWIESPMKGSLPTLWMAARAISRQISTTPPDVIHVHYRRSALVGRMVQRRQRTPKRPPVLYSLHLTDLPIGLCWRYFTDFGDHCHAPSAAAKRWLVQVGRVAEERVSLIPHGIDPARFPIGGPSVRARVRGDMGIPLDALAVAYVGRLEHPKNEMWILDLAERLPSVQFLLAGDGPNRGALKNRIASLGFASRVRLLGECDPVPIYHAANAFLLPSAREGFSYSCAEAMSCGIPVLRTRTAGTEEMVIEGVTGRSCDVNHEAFLQAAVSFVSDRHRLEEMGVAAAAHVREALSLQRQVSETVQLYHRLAAREFPRDQAGSHSVR